MSRSTQFNGSGAYWYELVNYLQNAGIPTNQLKQALTIVITLASGAFGCPLFTQLKARRPETISAIISPCLKVIPTERYLDSSLTPKLEPERFAENLVVSTSGTGLPSKATELLHQYFLRGELKTGYVGALQENDPLQEQSSVLVVDLENDTSGIVNSLSGHASIFKILAVDVQAVLLQNHLRLLHVYNPTFDVDVLKQALKGTAAPEMIPILRVAELVGKMSAIPFLSSGVDVSPIGTTKAFLPDMYRLSREILAQSVRVSKPLELEITENGLAIYKAIRELMKTGTTNHNVHSILIKLDEMNIPISKATVYRALRDLLTKEVVRKTNSQSGLYELVDAKIDYEAFPGINLPTVKELFPAQNVPEQYFMSSSNTSAPALGTGVMYERSGATEEHLQLTPNAPIEEADLKEPTGYEGALRKLSEPNHEPTPDDGRDGDMLEAANETEPVAESVPVAETKDKNRVKSKTRARARTESEIGSEIVPVIVVENETTETMKSPTAFSDSVDSPSTAQDAYN